MHSIKLMGGALAAVLTTTLAFMAPARAGDPKADLDEALGHAAFNAEMANRFDFDDWLNGSHLVTPDWGRKCLTFLATAKKLGATPDQPVKLQHKFPGASQKGDYYYAPLSAVETLCTERDHVFGALLAAYAVNKVQLSLDKLAGDYTPTENDTLLWPGDIQACNKQVAAALAAGVPADTKLAYTPEHTLGKAKVEVCDALGQAQKAAQAKQDAAAKAELDAKLAPYKKLMGGDKLRLIRDDNLYDDGVEIQGRGGYRIHTPKELKKAKVWFYQEQGDYDGGHAHWHLRRLQFRGDKLIKESVKRGRGQEAPARAYR